MIKRLFDVCVSAFALVVLSPLIFLTALVILISDGRPVFFCQNRLGKDKKLITICKFRSMTNNPKRITSQQVRLDNPEVTQVGRFLRRTKIDELPQIWSVLKGDLSIVGPRPALPRDWETYTPRQRHRLDVKGGLTCLAQIYGSSYLSWNERIEYDLAYITQQSFWLDMFIIFKTIVVILLGEERFVRHPVMNQYDQKNINRKEHR